MTNVKAMGEWLRLQRRAYGLTQAELAEYVGLQQRKVGRIENGEIQDPGFFDIARLAWWFGVNMAHIARIAGLEEELSQ